MGFGFPIYAFNTIPLPLVLVAEQFLHSYLLTTASLTRDLNSFLVYSCQVFFYLMRRYRFCPARRVPRRFVTSYPTLVLRKSSERRFYHAPLGLGC